MAIVFLLLLLAAEEPPLRGRLCIAKECTETTGRVFAVKPDDRARAWVWTSADASTVQLGVVPPKAEQVALDAGERTQLNATIAGARAWPLDVQADVRGRVQWQWTAIAPQKLRRLIVPRGRYAIQLRAEHHRAFSRVADANEKEVNLGELALIPLPLARGIVVDAEGKAIAGARVSDPDGELCTLSDPQGAFACELEEPFRQHSIVVSAAGYGDRETPLPRPIENDVDLGRIELTAGHRIHLRIIRPQAGPATVALYRGRERGSSTSAKLRTRELKEREEDVQFDAGKGEYAVLVSGSGPLERFELPITVTDEDVSETITIAPYRLEGTVRIGDEPLAAGELELGSRQMTWRGKLQVLDGAFAGTLWQSEHVYGHIASREVLLLESIEPPPLGHDPTRWDIRFESRLISGRVFDALTEAPVSGAQMRVHVETPRLVTTTNANIAPGGTYRINASRPGKYKLRVSSPSHVPAEVELTVTEGDAKRTVNLPLERGGVVNVQVVSPSGQPLGAWGYTQSGTATEGRMSHEGRFTLRGRPEEQRLLYVLPERGSFAVVRATIPKGDDATSMRVTVPEPTSALRVTFTSEGEAVGGMLLLRCNGEFVPSAIVSVLAGGRREQADSLFLPRLPSGVYELWAAGFREEDELIASNGTLRPPMRVELNGGEAAVRVPVVPWRRRE